MTKKKILQEVERGKITDGARRIEGMRVRDGLERLVSVPHLVISGWVRVAKKAESR